MTAIILKWIVIVSAAVKFGFMAFDGTRALATGDYITGRDPDNRQGNLDSGTKWLRLLVLILNHR